MLSFYLWSKWHLNLELIGTFYLWVLSNELSCMLFIFFFIFFLQRLKQWPVSGQWLPILKIWQKSYIEGHFDQSNCLLSFALHLTFQTSFKSSVSRFKFTYSDSFITTLWNIRFHWLLSIWGCPTNNQKYLAEGHRSRSMGVTLINDDPNL